jgi:hypothetical protein
MSCMFEVMLRSSEMVGYDSQFNVYNGKWGLTNLGSDPVTIDPTDGAISVKTTGLYRVTGNIAGDVNPSSSDSNELAQGYINLPPDQLKNGPGYPDPYYHGFQFSAQKGRITAPFSGTLVLTTWPKFSIYLSKNFTPAEPYTILLFELVQS